METYNSNRIEDFYTSQREEWKLLDTNVKNLEKIRTRQFIFDSFSLYAQNNPERIISTSAQVDEKSIKLRKCFLCQENLFREQKKISVGNYNILANPYPILMNHFTVAHSNHIPQRISNKIKDMFAITEIMGNDYLIFYNGPECGASCPDHMHFQAVKKSDVPLPWDITQTAYKKYILKTISGITEIKFWDDSLRKYITLESEDLDDIEEKFVRTIQSLEEVNGSEAETKINILAYRDIPKLYIIIIPREKHRPDIFYHKDNNLLLSPASIDIGGILVLPREEDYIRIDREIIKDVFSEIMLQQEKFQLLINQFL